MFTGMELMSCPNLAVPAEVMHHIVDVESGSNPYAIGVVGGKLVRQPRNLAEALATVQMLDTKGYNYSLGVAQVNRANLGKYGLDSYEKAFNPCANLSAGARILAACYASSGSNWGKAFSCYYSGNFTTGFRDGYVQKVYDSIQRDANASSTAQAIPLQSTARPDAPEGSARKTVFAPSNEAAYRVALRSVMIDTATTALVSAVAKEASPEPGAAAKSPSPDLPAPSHVPAPTVATTAAALGVAATPAYHATLEQVFEPQVRGPNDPPSVASASQPPATTASAADHADLRQGGSDAAFVF